jgi:hypothetical protein
MATSFGKFFTLFLCVIPAVVLIFDFAFIFYVIFTSGNLDKSTAATTTDSLNEISEPSGHERQAPSIWQHEKIT